MLIVDIHGGGGVSSMGETREPSRNGAQIGFIALSKLPPRVFLTKRYDVPYNCKICVRTAPLITFESSARSLLSGRFAGMSFQSTNVNAGYNRGYMVRSIFSSESH